MIEVLIALLILFISLLGSAAMQLNALKHTARALISTQDSFIAYSRLIRMAGMLGCLSIDRIVDAPPVFKTPVSWQGGVLRMISPDVALQAAKPDWTVVSDCATYARAYPGAKMTLTPGEMAFPLRELFYRFEHGQLKIGPNKTVLLDNVAAFDVSFGIADLAGSHSGLRYENRLAKGSSLRSIRIGLTLRDRAGRVKDQAYQLEVALRNLLA